MSVARNDTLDTDVPIEHQYRKMKRKSELLIGQSINSKYQYEVCANDCATFCNIIAVIIVMHCQSNQSLFPQLPTSIAYDSNRTKPYFLQNKTQAVSKMLLSKLN
jgi:hypothetical protein